MSAMTIQWSRTLLEGQDFPLMDNAKSYIFHTELIVTDKPMQCVYLVKEECHAQPFIYNNSDYYKPSEDEIKTFCLESGRFRTCPRLLQFESYLEKAAKR
jgi:succinylarginine dihydrolase